VPVWPLGDMVGVTVTGLPNQHLSADWLAVAARAASPTAPGMYSLHDSLASPLLCVAVTFKFVCEIRGK